MPENLIRDYIMSFVGIPYRWGGDDPMGGYDCSGFVQEILAAFGKDPPGDQTADSLYRHFLKHGDLKSYCNIGYLLFYGSAQRITHTGIGVTTGLMAEAGGGDSRTLSVKDASARNAFVRIRPYRRRPDLIAVIDPLF
jgi:cell wall-associated NlpC family hydrolase